METVVLNSESKENLKLVTKLAKKIGIKVKYLSEDEKEDIALINAITKGRTGKFIDTDAFISKLEK